MINLYRIPNGTIFLHEAQQSEAIQLDPGTRLDYIEQVIQKIAKGSLHGLVVVPMKQIHEARADAKTDILYMVDKDLTAFYRRYIALLETDLIVARLPHPLEPDVIAYLEGILTELEGMSALAPAESEEARANYDAWMQQSTRMIDLEANAESYASWLAPKPVQVLLTKIRQRRNLLRAKR